MSDANVFSVVFDDKASLAKQYMPFIEQGGLFIRTEEAFTLADIVSLSVQLSSDCEKYDMSGRVVWLTPSAAERGLPQGIGVQLMGNQGRILRHKIEQQLAEVVDKPILTDTM